MQHAAQTLDAWMALRGQPLAVLQADLGFSSDALKQPARYINLGDLIRLYDQRIHPARFYFHGDGSFVLIYLEYPAAEFPELTPEALRSLLGASAAQLPSRADDDHLQYVYPAAGVAYSAGHAEVSFIEIFQPTTLEQYRAQFYLDPTQLGDEG
jgi:hypothetical protein